MKYKSFDTYIMDEGEPAFRSCWECNGAHEHLKDTDFLHVCFSCGRYWIHGYFLDEFESQEKLDEFLKAHLTTAAPDAAPQERGKSDDPPGLRR